MVHYFEEEAVKSYTSYLEMVEDGLVENVPAPTLAIGYYGLGQDAKLSDLIKCVRADEQRHAIANAQLATDKPLKQANNLKRVHQVQEKTELAPTQKQKDAA
jgi:hypothetical protein